MSEVKVEKSKSLARRETPGLSPFNDFFTPAFSARFVGLSPFAMMREFTEEMDRLYRANGPALKPGARRSTSSRATAISW